MNIKNQIIDSLNKLHKKGLFWAIKAVYKLINKTVFNYLGAIKNNFFVKKMALDELNQIITLNHNMLKNYQSKVLLKKTVDSFFPGKFFFKSSQQIKIINIIKEYFPSSIEIVLNEANKIIEHKFSFLGVQMNFVGEIDWHHCFTKEKQWPLRFYKLIKYKNSELIPDIKFAWELNRHQYFIKLAKAYWYSNDPKFGEEYILQISSWIDNNPYQKGINWISSMEIGLRLISWVWTYYFFKNYISNKHEFLRKFLSSFVLQLRHIEKNLSIHDTPNNHLLGEACALIVGGIFLGKGQKQEEWIQKGWTILKDQINKQFYVDGVNKEQAMSYHRFSLEFYLLAVILLKKNSIVIPDYIDKSLEKAFEFIMYCIKPNGECPTFGDTDNAKAVFLSTESYNQYRGILAVGAVLFNRADMKKVAGSVSEDVVWLLGWDGVMNFEAIREKIPQKNSILFPYGGYFIMRSSWNQDANYMFFDCGPLGLGEAASHGHADALSFELYSQRSSFLVDPGTYTYNGSSKWRNFFRSTFNHNTATVDRKNQSIIKSRMEWKCHTNVIVRKQISCRTCDYIEAEHDGYRHLKNLIIHRRRIFFNKKTYWIINDLFEGYGKHNFAVNFHFNPDTCLEQNVNNFKLMINNKNLSLSVLGNDSLNHHIFKGSNNPIAGWFSQGYGEKKVGFMLQFVWKDIAPTQMTTLLYSDKTSSDIKIENLKQLLSDNEILAGSLAVKILGFKHSDTLILLNNQDSLIDSSILKFKGEMLFFSQNSNGEIIDVYIRNGYYAEIAGREIISSDKLLNEWEYI
ncbi:putative Heparin-sulfate lyase N-terminal domain-containing protein [Candidatus Magnetomoraceae bacterium gMMP-1]